MVRRELRGRNGSVLVADAYGPVDGPGVLLLHGGGQTRHAWGNTAKRLGAAGWQALSMDLPGHGESSWAEDGNYLLEDGMLEIAEVFAQLGRPLVAVGASMGGLLSLSATLVAPTALDALVLVDIAPRMEPAGVARIMAFMHAHPNGFASLDEAAEHIAGYTPERQRQVRPEGLAKNLRQRDDGRWVWHWDPALLAEHNFGGAPQNALFDQAAAALTLPCLLVRGRMSDVLSPDGVAHFLELAPQAEYVDLEQAGHMVAGDLNDRFCDAVLAFMQRLPIAPT